MRMEDPGMDKQCHGVDSDRPGAPCRCWRPQKIEFLGCGGRVMTDDPDVKQVLKGVHYNPIEHPEQFVK